MTEWGQSGRERLANAFKSGFLPPPGLCIDGAPTAGRDLPPFPAWVLSGSHRALRIWVQNMLKALLFPGAQAEGTAPACLISEMPLSRRYSVG